ncbi:MAG: universal stress protein [Acidobacteriia bacterium]|nr:universal stress protein [Terriglobia bacterium]
MSDFETLVVTTDFSESSRRAFAPAMAIARKFSSTVVVVHVVEDRLPAFVDEFAAIPVEEILDSQARRAAQELQQFVKPYEGSGVPLERVVLRGTPHLEIARLAAERKAALVAMSTHGRGFISHALFGSTTERVVRRAPCPVLTVRGPEPKERGGDAGPA